MHRITTHIIATAMLLMPLAASAQNTYVSKEAADVISSGKFYLRFDMPSDEDDNGKRIKVNLATAVKDGVTCTLNEDAEAYTLTSAKGTFMLDTKNKTFRAMPQGGQQFDLGRLTFSKQATCKLNGKDFYFDEYRTAKGGKVRFFYNSTKIAAIDFGIAEMPVINISELNKKIPDNMIMCLTPEWKVGQQAGTFSVGGNLQQQIVEQMRAEIDPDDLPEGMTVDDVINMALGKMNNIGGNQTQQPAAPQAQPPRCQQRYKDPSQSTDYADPTPYKDPKITDIKYVTSPVYASHFSKPKTDGLFDTSLEVSDKGITQQLQFLEKEFEGKTPEQIDKYLETAASDVMTALQLNLVNGKLIEYGLALCVVRPSALNYNNAGLLMAYKGESENAKDLFMTALSFDEQNAVIQVNIAEYFLEKGDLTNARRYAEQAALLEPDFGEAYQILTGINLKEGKVYEAARTLFKSAETYFNEITAKQFFSLMYNLRLEQRKVAKNPSYPYMNVVNKIFTQENLESLARATKAGGVSNGQDVIPNMKEFKWPVNNAEIWELHESYLSKSDHKISDAIERIDERNKKIMDDDRYALCYYETMGMQDVQTELDRTEQILKSEEGINLNLQLPQINMYREMNSIVAEDGQVVYYPDARQFWCLKMWECYYEIMLQYYQGFWYEGGKGNPVNYPKSYAEYQNRIDKKEANHKLDEDAFLEQLKEIAERLAKCLEKAETERQEAQCEYNAAVARLSAGETFVRGKVQTFHIDIMHLNKDYYNLAIKPTLEEWWQKMIAMGAYCDKYAVQEFFENNCLRAVNLAQLDVNYREAWYHGSLIQKNWEIYVEKPYQEAAYWASKLAQLPPDPPKPAEQRQAFGNDGYNEGNCQLKNYGEKEKPWIEFGVQLGALGRIGLRRESNGDISITNEGNTITGTNKKWNLSNGQTTTTGYPTLADERTAEQRSITNRIKNYALSQAESIPYIGKVIACAKNDKDGTGFQPWAGKQEGAHSVITTDANGNITGSSRVNFKEYSLRNLPHGLSFTVHREEHRSGTYRRTKTWASIGLTAFDFRTGD